MFGGGVGADADAGGFVWDGGWGADGWWECGGIRGNGDGLGRRGDGSPCDAEDYTGDD